jgi:voltage-gated potassium channel
MVQGMMAQSSSAGAGQDEALPRSFRHLSILQLPQRSPWQTLLRRLALAIGLVLATTLLLWFTREGLRDNAHPERPLNFTTIFYFTIVSLTTLGYGDIAPVTDGARLLNALLLTPARIFILLLFVGTAYELTQLRARYGEGYRMQQLRERLSGHTIVCGFGVKGRAIVNELVAHGQQPQDIVVIDPVAEATEEAAARGFVALRGDASTEALLTAAVIHKAAHVLVAPNRDDACVLICLTVRSLAPDVWLVAAAREEENIKILYRTGANLVVSPSLSGGRLMGAAVRQRAVPLFLEDLLSFGRGVDAAERVVRQGEAGQHASALPDLTGTLILGVQRGDHRYTFDQVAALPLAAGDRIVFLCADGTQRVGREAASEN